MMCLYRKLQRALLGFSLLQMIIGGATARLRDRAPERASGQPREAWQHPGAGRLFDVYGLADGIRKRCPAFCVLRSALCVRPRGVLRSALCALPFALGLLAALLPARVWAACGVQDLGACVDDAQYNLWYGLAGMGWALDRTLLMLAYQLDVFRWWLVEVAFSSAYAAMVTLIDPLLVPIATVAIIIGSLGFLLLPLLGRVELVKLRHALVWAVLAPLLLTLSGPLIVQLEQARSDLGSALFTGASQIAPGAIFGAAASDMRAPSALYPSNPCGAPLDRRSASGVVRMDDLAAAMLWADAEDIHCPDLGGPGADIPDAFYEAAPSGPGYATEERVGLMNDAAGRAAAIESMQRGAVRLFLGLLPASLAVLDALVQLVFALCLVALWVGLPIGLLFVFFQQTAGGVTGLFRRAVAVLQVSWSGSFLLGIVFACLLAAADLRNATAYTGFAVGAMVLTAYILAVAVDTLKDSIRTLNETVAAATGLSVTRPFEMAGAAATGALAIGAAAATGGAAAAASGAAMAFTAEAARRQTGSGQYAAAAALGRIRPLAQVGEVATLMGALDPHGELASGLYAGSRSRRSLRGMRLQMAADAKRKDDAGLTFAQRAQERRLGRELRRGQSRPTVTAPADHDQADELDGLAERAPLVVQSGWRRVRAERPAGADGRPGARVAPVALALDTRGRLHSMTIDPEEIPPDAVTEARARLNLPRLLTLGYRIQEQRDGHVTVWRAAGQRDDAAPPTSPAAIRLAQAEERSRLIAAGALIGDAAQASAELHAARTALADEARAAQHAAELGRAFARGPAERVARLARPGDPSTGAAQALASSEAPEALPADAMSVPIDQADPGRLLQLGYAVQRSHDGNHILLWRPDRPADAPAPTWEELEAERRRLAAAGALLGAAAASGIVAGTDPSDPSEEEAERHDRLTDRPHQQVTTAARLGDPAHGGEPGRAAAPAAGAAAPGSTRRSEAGRAGAAVNTQTPGRGTESTTHAQAEGAGHPAPAYGGEDVPAPTDLPPGEIIAAQDPPRTRAEAERSLAQLAVDLRVAEQQLQELRAAAAAQAAYLRQTGHPAEAAQVERWAASRRQWLEGQQRRWAQEQAGIRVALETLPVEPADSAQAAAELPTPRLTRTPQPWPQSLAEVEQQLATVEQALADLGAEQEALAAGDAADEAAVRRLATITARRERLQARRDAYAHQRALLTAEPATAEEA
ncbi:MAG: hypothetical protein HXY37_08760 [Chloroflexi bacterium]|nr:hypothetical protein [Chloroflexota bacterium]